MKKLNLLGKKIGNWTVVSFSHTNRRGIWWLCQCDCGSESVIVAAELNRSKSKHCVDCSPGPITHGMRYTPEYRVWLSMRQRCNNSNDKNYSDYGGRGIHVCQRWESFESFIVDMGKRPDKKYSLNRADNDGPYSPENCEWSTMKVQANNTRRNTLITFNNKTRTISEWADKTGISYVAILHRISEKWSIDRMLTERTRKMQFHMITFNEKSQTIKEWSRDLGINYTTLYARIVYRGWSIDRAFTEKPLHK